MYVLTAIPIVAFFGLDILQPEYLAPMLTDSPRTYRAGALL